MDNMKLNFVDKVNVLKAKYIFNMDKTQFKNTFWDKHELKQCGDKWNIDVYINSVRTFLKKVIKNQKENEDYALISQKYKFCEGMDKGRIYVHDFGVQSLQGKLRKFLTGDYLIDIDIKNCHFNILAKIIKDYNSSNINDKLDYPYIKKYIQYRTNILHKENLNKTDFLICLNSDILKTNNKFLQFLHKEKQEIYKIIIKSDFCKDIQTTNKLNPISSKMNKLFCIYENQIIQSVMKHDIIVPMFDGFMFQKELKEEYDYLLDWDSDICWGYKSNISNIEIDDFTEQESLDYASVKKRFELDNFCIREPLSYAHTIKNYEGKEIVVFKSATDYTQMYKPIKYINEFGNKVSFLKEWYDDGEKRIYEMTDFIPYGVNDNMPDYIYNEFKGFDSELLDRPDDISWFLDFIKENIANEDEDVKHYMIDYIAHMFQYPEVNPQSCLVIRGESGVGKDTLIDFIELLMGSANDYVFRTADVFSVFPDKNGFNCCLKNKLLIQFNETEGKDGVDIKEKLKDQITREHNNIHEKFKKEYKQRNYARIIVNSNNTSPLQVMFDERKINIFKCSAKNKGNRIYWKSIHDKKKSKRSLDSIYTYLMNRNLDNFNPLNAPRTQSFINDISNAIPIYARFLQEVFIERSSKYIHRASIIILKGGNIAIGARDLNKLFLDYGTDNYLIKEQHFNSRSCRKQLMEYDSITFNKSIRIDSISKKYVYIEIDKLRNNLEKYTFITNADEEEVLETEQIFPDSDED